MNDAISTTAATGTTPIATVKGPDPAEILGDSVSSSHVVTSVAGELHYSATAGRITVGAEAFEDGKFQGNEARAEVFVASYVLDLPETERAARPVTFIFNGGPGSPTVWLQFGLFGPHLIDTGDVDSRVAPPYSLSENAETLLIDSDLVFIDPMTTGFSRAAAGADPTTFHGYAGDRDLVADVIRLWATKNNRWISPKFLAGESYGTTRAAAIAKHLLRRYGMALNGVILLSTVLDFATIDENEGNDEPYVNYLPTYAATAHYHGMHPGRELRDVVQEAQTFAEGEYRLALAKGSRLPAEELDRIVTRVATLIGVSEQYVRNSNLRIRHTRYAQELRRSEGLTVGRLDTRFVQHTGHAHLDDLETDPSYEFILQPYAFAANHYFRAVLGYETELTYELLSGRVFPWSYGEFENASVTSADDLAAVVRSNPDFKVYLAHGFYDAATPYAGAEHVFAHLRVPSSAHENFVSYYYEAGHMMYVHPEIRVAQSQHIRAFVRWAIGTDEKPQVGAEYRFHDLWTGN